MADSIEDITRDELIRRLNFFLRWQTTPPTKPGWWWVTQGPPGRPLAHYFAGEYLRAAESMARSGWQFCPCIPPPPLPETKEEGGR